MQPASRISGTRPVLSSRMVRPPSLIWTSLIDGWLSSPAAVTSTILGIVGLAFALYQFRFVPRERKRETLDAMQKSFKLSQKSRGVVLPALPHFLLDARADLAAKLKQNPCQRPDLVLEFSDWKEPTDTAAHEILCNEAKFRCALFAIGHVIDFRAEAGAEAEAAAAAEAASAGAQAVGRVTDTPTEQDAAAMATHTLWTGSKRLITELNDFAQLVELDLFPEDDVLGQFHRAIAPACKAVEPVIWSENVLGGRWGLRVLRLQLRAEHFNDVKPIHRASALQWEGKRGAGEDRVTLIRAPLYEDYYGEHAPSADLPRSLRLRLAVMARWVRITKRYGGSRLRLHLRDENKLLGRLRFACEPMNPDDPDGPQRLDPNDLNWRLGDVDVLIDKQREIQQAEIPGNAATSGIAARAHVA